MANCVIAGVNWGDEGKGRMVDYLTARYQYVVRFQGGGNAGHTVINNLGKFALHLLPSGIFRPNVVNVLGSAVALDLESLFREIDQLAQAGVRVSPDNLKISERASLLMPWHRQLDELEENRLKDKKYGSTRQGIAPFYADKYQKKTVMAGELLDRAHALARFRDILEWKNLTLQRVYGAEPYTEAALEAWMDTYGQRVLPFLCDTASLLSRAQADGQGILFEAQLGTLRDVDCGIWPYTTSSNTLAAYAPIGSGFPGARLDDIVGVAKAYSTCVGEGPFTCEWFGPDAEKLREAGHEYGAKTGRPRRVGPLDLVATRYGAKMQGVTALALTKMDVLSYMDTIPVCVRYRVNGEETGAFPFPSLLPAAEPVYTHLPGWKCDISGARSFDELPKAAQQYVLYVENALGFPIRYVSVGPERESLIVRA